jgi:hypothetical protein
MSWVSKTALLAVAIVLFAGSAFAQTGAVRGTVMDATGAVVPGVNIEVINLQTGQVTAVESSGAGIYQLNNVPIGTYRLNAQVPGFKTFSREPVRIETSTTTTVDVGLELGEPTQTVVVEGTVAPLIQTDNAEMSTIMEEKMVLDLPLDIGRKTTSGGGSGRRQIEGFMYLTPGVTGNQWGKHILGSTEHTNQNIIDGIPYTPQETPGLMASTSPPYEAVAEYKISTTQYPSQVGRGMGITTYTFKSGTNAYHGNAYWIFRHDKLDARGFFATQKSRIRQNEVGFRIGGPIVKDKTFFFFSYQDFRRRGGANLGIDTIPPVDFRQGDFSRYRDLQGNLLPIFDPATTRGDGRGGFERTPFENNRVPSARFDPIAVQTLATIPNPDYDGIINNWERRAKALLDDHPFALRLDHNLTANQHISGSWWRVFRRNTGYSSWGGAPPETGVDEEKGTDAWRFNWDYVIRPNLIHHFGVGGNRDFKTKFPLSDVDVTANPFGIPGLPADAYGTPTFNLGQTSTSIIGSPVSYLAMGNSTNLTEDTHDRALIFVDNFTWVKGKHTFQFGGEIWHSEFRRYDRRNSGGVFNVSALSTSQPNSPNFQTWGEPVASFLLGEMFSGTVRINPVPATYKTRYLAMFAEDKFQVTPKLTLSLGLRYEIPWAIREADSRIAIVDLNLPNPAAGGLPGAYVYGNDAVRPPLNLRDFGPRVGLAYRLNPRTVVRSGFGIIYAQSNALSSGVELNGNSLLTGYRAEHTVPSLDGGITPAFVLSEGMPVLNVTLPSLDPGLFVGGVADYLAPNSGRAPYTVNYNLTVQRELGWGLFVEGAYVGAKATRLGANLENFNQVPSSFLGLGPTLQSQVGSDQANAAGITAPYPGFKGSVAQALRPFPQYTNWVTHANGIGNMTYHSLQLSLQRRFASGFGALVNYTFSKTITDVGSGALWASVGNASLDTANRRLEKALASYDQPHVLNASWVYELPLTRQTSGAKAKILGGWQVAAAMQYASGTPIGITGGPFLPIFNVGNRPNSVLNVDQSQWDGDPASSLYLNRAAFSASAPFTLGNVGKNLPSLRRPFNFDENLNISKRTPIPSIRENFLVEFRAEFSNLFNRVVFSGPSSDFNNATNFGRVSGQANNPRSIQLFLKFHF